MFFVREKSCNMGFSWEAGVSLLPKKTRYFATSLKQNILVSFLPYWLLKETDHISAVLDFTGLPSMRTRPFSFAVVYVPQSRRSW